MGKQKNSIREKFEKEIKPQLKKSLGKKNIYQVPKLEKIVLNIGFGKSNPDKKQKEQIFSRLSVITGQKPMFTKAKKAIAGFKLREEQVIGAKVTLRNERMYHFFEKIVSIVMPRLRDFRGMSESSFDGRGNYTIGFQEINVFPEVEYTRGEKATGLEVVICTSASNDIEAKELLVKLGVPFKDKVNEKKDLIEVKS